MKRIFTRAASLLCAFSMVFSLSGCADTSWIVKVDNITVPSGVYLTYLIMASQSVISGGGTSSGSSDPWSQTIGGVNAVTWAKNQAVNACTQLAVIKSLCAKKNITLSDSEKTVVSQEASASTSAQNSVYAKNGISAKSIEDILSVNYFLIGKLFDSYYAKGGETPVSDSDLKNYFTNNYVQVKQIFFNKYDEAGKLLSGTEQKAVKDKADKVLGQISADRSNFDQLVKDNNKDPVMNANPKGLIFNKSDTSYPTEFITTAFAMNVGDVKLIESSQGWHIIYRVQLDSDASWFGNSTNKESVLRAMKSNDFKTIIDEAVKKAGVTKNDKAVARYNPKKLKLS